MVGLPFVAEAIIWLQGITFSLSSARAAAQGVPPTGAIVKRVAEVGARAMALPNTPFVPQVQGNGTPQLFARMTAGKSSSQARSREGAEKLGPKWLRSKQVVKQAQSSHHQSNG